MERGRLAGHLKEVFNQDRLSQVREGGRCWKLCNNVRSDEFLHHKKRTLFIQREISTVHVHKVWISGDLKHSLISVLPTIAGLKLLLKLRAELGRDAEGSPLPYLTIWQPQVMPVTSRAQRMAERSTVQNTSNFGFYN